LHKEGSMKRKQSLLTLTLFVLAALLTAVSGPLSSAVELPAALKPLALPLVLGVAFLVGFFAFLQYFLQEKTESPVPPPSQQNRQRLLDRVRTFWIKDVLEQSLYDAVLIALGLQGQPDAVANPLRPYLQQPDQQAQPLPPGIRIRQVYDDADGELLILGEPGSGKTTLLLELARDLLDLAKSDETFPMPVVFNLSSWAVKRQPFTDWLIEELNTNYQVPRKLGQAWVDADQVLPLLDGLDEVALAYRAACVDAINAFRQEHGLLPVVVCSRSANYLALKQRLLLGSAVVVQPLTRQQIDEYLSSVGEPREAVRAALRDDLVFQELATTPLFLNVLTLALHGVSAKDFVAADSLEDRRRRLFDDYVMAMLQRRRPEIRYNIQQTLSWLRWLARQLVHNHQTEFYIERLQIDWLSKTLSRWVYLAISGLLGGLVTGLFFGLVAGLVFGPFFGLVAGLTTVALFFDEKEPREHTCSCFLRYFTYDWKCAATCSKRAVVMCSPTPIYLL
jgi:hypothetical protein